MPARQPKPIDIDRKCFETNQQVKIILAGSDFSTLINVHITLKEEMESSVTWDEHPPVESSTDGTTLTFHATPRGHATWGIGRLNVTVTNDDWWSSGTVRIRVVYYNKPGLLRWLAGRRARGIKKAPKVIEICPKVFERDAKCEQFHVIGKNFKKRGLFGYSPWKKKLTVRLEDTSPDGGPKVKWTVPAPGEIQINHDGTMLTFETTPSCPPPTHGPGKLTVTVENNERYSRDYKEFDIKFV
jgi:hypothetical protein